MSDIHIKIDAIKGESAIVGHKDEIEVDSWHWAVTNAVPAGGGSGSGSGRPQFADLVFVHRADRASPELWRACTLGRSLASAVLTVTRGGGSGAAQDYLAITLRDVRVTSVSLADAADDGQRPMESVSLAYRKAEYQYRPQKTDGSLGPAVKFGYDLKTNKPL